MKLPVLAWNGAVWWAPAETQSRGGPAAGGRAAGWGHAAYSVFRKQSPRVLMRFTSRVFTCRLVNVYGFCQKRLNGTEMFL